MKIVSRLECKVCSSELSFLVDGVSLPDPREVAAHIMKFGACPAHQYLIKTVEEIWNVREAARDTRGDN